GPELLPTRRASDHQVLPDPATQRQATSDRGCCIQPAPCSSRRRSCPGGERGDRQSSVPADPTRHGHRLPAELTPTCAMLVQTQVVPWWGTGRPAEFSPSGFHPVTGTAYRQKDRRVRLQNRVVSTTARRTARAISRNSEFQIF